MQRLFGHFWSSIYEFQYDHESKLRCSKEESILFSVKKQKVKEQKQKRTDTNYYSMMKHDKTKEVARQNLPHLWISPMCTYESVVWSPHPTKIILQILLMECRRY